MGRISAISAYSRRALGAVVALPVRVVRGLWDLVADDAARPAVLYVVALLLALFSFGSYLTGGGGAPSRVEFGLQLGSFGVVFYMSLRQAGSGGGRGR